MYGGLTWSPNTPRVNWVKAKAYCAAFNGLGLTGWRQPNLDETVNLIKSGAINGHGWVLNDYYWTSQQDYMGRPVAVDWFGGYIWVEGGNKEDSANEARVTCVR